MTNISAGGAFCLCSNSSFLYGWGYGEMGQLANESQDSPTPHLFSLKERGILDMAAGGQHSVLLLTFKK
jgi:regulator of chromosome condensation